MGVAHALPSINERDALGLGAATLAGGVALLAALITGPEIGEVNARVEGLAGVSGGLLSNLAFSLPLGYAFAAGMVAALNPCGFALLPAYLGVYVGERGGRAENSTLGQVWRSLQVSASVTAAFVLLFATAGLLLSLGAGALARHLPWAGLGIGIGLLVIGGRQLAGKALYTRWGEMLADRFGAAAGSTSLSGFFAYGLVYGLGSLSCTLPIFLAVVGTSWTAAGPLVAALDYFTYAVGMGTVIAILTVSAGVLKSATLARIRAVTPYVLFASAVLVLLAGAYVVYYWLTIGGLLDLVA